MPRLLIIIADDLGVDALRSYGDDGGDYAQTPRLDALCRDGVRFTQAWSAPTCTPTRGTILTGRFGFRTGLGSAGSGAEIDLDEVTLPRVLSARSEPLVAHANIGKWHLGRSAELGRSEAPNRMGWEHFSGTLAGSLPDYSEWEKIVDGETEDARGYATTENVDDALSWIDGRPADAPWLVWLAFNAPHSPLHLPPAELHGHDDLSGTPEDITAQPAAYYRAMVEAMDHEIGRLHDALEGRGITGVTTIFLGDNGSPGNIVRPPLTRMTAKDSLSEGGIRVPMCAAGAAVRRGGRNVDAPVHTADLFATALELFGVDPALDDGITRDAVSILPHLQDDAGFAGRSWNYSENFDAERRNGVAYRDTRYKLLRYDGESDQLYDLIADPYEQDDLMPRLESDAALRARYDALVAGLEALTGRR